MIKQSDQGIGVRKGHFRPMLFPPSHVSHVTRRYAYDYDASLNRICVGRMRDPVQKRLPDSFRLLGVQSLRYHFDLERVVGIHAGLLSPMVVEEMPVVKAHELANQ